MSKQESVMSISQIDPGAGVAHAASAGAVLLGWASWIVGFYPTAIISISTTVALAFYCTQLLESKTVQTYLKNRRRRKLHRLQRELEMLKARHADPEEAA